MWKIAVILLCLNGYCLAGPVGQKRNMPIVQQRNEDGAMLETGSAANETPNGPIVISTLSLPSNATSIRDDITDGFSCENKTYGYYADVDNDCQIFHVCLPVTYADGKEKTFRWSFICPEDTIFSQDSFTCMRPDDMTITCEESYQYYELNRNFGMVDSNEDKETSNENSASETAVYENVSETENEAEPVKPLMQKEEEQFIAQSNPVNKPKPSRRKPAISYTSQRKPANSYPLRKMPQTSDHSQDPESPAQQVSQDVRESIQTVEKAEIKPVVNKFSRRPVSSLLKDKMPQSAIKTVIADAKENIQPETEEVIKPVVHKFSRRPVTAITNSIKDKVQNSNAQSENGMPTRTDLFNQIRKRPNLFNKKTTERPENDKPEEEQAKVETPQEQQNFSDLATDMPNSNTETQVADTAIEASESNHVFVKPQETNEIPQNVETTNIISEEPVQVLEAFEEIPTVISEIVETPNTEEENTYNEQFLTISNEKSDHGEEPQIIEEAESAEESKTYENVQLSPAAQEAHISGESQTTMAKKSQIAVKTQTDDEPESVQEPQAVEEAPEIPQSLRSSAEEIQNIDETKEAEESQTAGETQNAQEYQVDEVIQNIEEQQTANKNENREEIPTLDNDELQGAEEVEDADKVTILEEISSADKTETNVEEMPESLETNVDAEQHSSVETHRYEEAEQTQDEDFKSIQSEEQTHSMEETIANSEETNQIQAAEALIVPAEETLVAEEPQPLVHQMGVSQFFEKLENIEDHKPVDENFEEENVSAALDSNITAEDQMIKQTSEENDKNMEAAQTVEQMESEKPAYVPESIQAIEEMSPPSAMVQQMYDDMNMSKQLVKGFKPVDPVMAQEAEQLIADFINTLRKNDFTNETPGMHVAHHADEASLEQEADNSMGEVQNEQKAESNQENEEETSKYETVEQEDETPAEISETAKEPEQKMQEALEMDYPRKEAETDNDATQETDAFKSLETESIKNGNEYHPSHESVAEVMLLPQEMYQIPVKVISGPAEEMAHAEEQSHESEIKSSAMIANTEEKTQEEESPAMPMAGKNSLSIDDIVELVKERLDHMPKIEMETPMQLEQVLGEVHEVKTKEDEQPSTAVEEGELQSNSQSVEEQVMPIYQRTVTAVQANAGEPTETLKRDSDGTVKLETSADVSEIKEKTNRSYKPRLDSRKRRFFFKGDSS